MHCVWIGKGRRNGLGRTHPLETSRAKPGEDGTASDALQMELLAQVDRSPAKPGLKKAAHPTARSNLPTAHRSLRSSPPAPCRPNPTLLMKERAPRGFPDFT